MTNRKCFRRVFQVFVDRILIYCQIGCRRQIKTRGNDTQRVNALEQLKRARQGGQGTTVEEVN
jgi:hypothetical protein